METIKKSNATHKSKEEEGKYSKGGKTLTFCNTKTIKKLNATHKYKEEEGKHSKQGKILA